MLRYIKALFGHYDHKWIEFDTTFGLQPIQGSSSKFLVGNDWHYGSEYMDNMEVPHYIDDILHDKFPEIILNGDIIDMSCCPVSQVSRLRSIQEKLIKKLGENFRFGNHCRKGVQYYDLVKTTVLGKKVWFEHGDLIGKNAEKWFKYRHKPAGSTKLGLLKTKLFDSMDWLKAKRPLPKNFIEDCHFEMDAKGYDIAVLAHFHPDKARRYEYKGKVIIILPAHKLNEVWL